MELLLLIALAGTAITAVLTAIWVFPAILLAAMAAIGDGPA